MLLLPLCGCAPWAERAHVYAIHSLSHLIVTLHSAAASCYRDSINYQGGLRDPCGYSNPSRELNSAFVAPLPLVDLFPLPPPSFFCSPFFFCLVANPRHYSISSLIAPVLENTKRARDYDRLRTLVPWSEHASFLYIL